MFDLNLLVVGIYFLVVIFNGLYAAKNVSSVSDFATGNKSYSAFFIFATLSASFIGGGFTTGLAEKVYTHGLIYVCALFGFSLKEILIALYIVPKMSAFKDAISVGDIMEQLYGRKARIFTGIAAVLVSAGIAGAQFSAFGYIIKVLIGINQEIGVILAASIVILYSSLGGIKAVVANDTLHFIVLIIALPLVFILGVNHIGVAAFTSEINFSTEKLPLLELTALFLSFFFGETLVPPYVQRLLIGRDMHQTKLGTIYSGVLSVFFFFMIGLIGVIATKIDSSINPNHALTTVINTVMPVGLKGLAIAGMTAVVMSSADAFLNAASVSASHDVIKPLCGNISKETELYILRFSTVIIGLIGAYFALKSESVLDILLYSYTFWTPFILVPLVSGILGVRKSSYVFWMSSIMGVLSVIIISKFSNFNSTRFDATLFGIAANAIVFFGLKDRKIKRESRKA